MRSPTRPSSPPPWPTLIAHHRLLRRQAPQAWPGLGDLPTSAGPHHPGDPGRRPSRAPHSFQLRGVAEVPDRLPATGLSTACDPLGGLLLQYEDALVTRHHPPRAAHRVDRPAQSTTGRPRPATRGARPHTPQHRDRPERHHRDPPRPRSPSTRNWTRPPTAPRLPRPWCAATRTTGTPILPQLGRSPRRDDMGLSAPSTYSPDPSSPAPADVVRAQYLSSRPVTRRPSGHPGPGRRVDRDGRVPTRRPRPHTRSAWPPTSWQAGRGLGRLDRPRRHLRGRRPERRRRPGTPPLPATGQPLAVRVAHHFVVQVGLIAVRTVRRHCRSPPHRHGPRHRLQPRSTTPSRLYEGQKPGSPAGESGPRCGP